MPAGPQAASWLSLKARRILLARILERDAARVSNSVNKEAAPTLVVWPFPERNDTNSNLSHCSCLEDAFEMLARGAWGKLCGSVGLCARKAR